MESYKLCADGQIQRQSDLALIPPNESNADYVKYLKDVDSGAEVTQYDYQAEEARQIAEQAKLAKEKETEDLIQAKIREQAISALKVEGKLDNDGKLVKAVEPEPEP